MTNGKKMLLGGLALVAAALLIGRSTAAPGDARSDAGGTKVAVCDVIDILGRMQRGIDLAAEFRRRSDALRAESERKSKEIEEGRAVLEELQEGSPDAEAQYQKVQQLQIEFRVWQEAQAAALERERILLTRRMYREIVQETGAYAREQGIDVILHERRGEPAASEFGALLDGLNQRKIVYSAENVDITDAIVDRLNARYEASRQP